MKSESELIAEGSKYIPKDYDPDLYRIRHSAAHVMAQAVREVYPEVQFAIGPPTAKSQPMRPVRNSPGRSSSWN